MHTHTRMHSHTQSHTHWHIYTCKCVRIHTPSPIYPMIGCVNSRKLLSQCIFQKKNVCICLKYTTSHLLSFMWAYCIGRKKIQYKADRSSKHFVWCSYRQILHICNFFFSFPALCTLKWKQGAPSRELWGERKVWVWKHLIHSFLPFLSLVLEICSLIL